MNHYEHTKKYGETHETHPCAAHHNQPVENETKSLRFDASIMRGLYGILAFDFQAMFWLGNGNLIWTPSPGPARTWDGTVPALH